VHPLQLGDGWVGVSVALEVDVAALFDVVRLNKEKCFSLKKRDSLSTISEARWVN
jgi:hypothetical protein